MIFKLTFIVLFLFTSCSHLRKLTNEIKEPVKKDAPFAVWARDHNPEYKSGNFPFGLGGVVEYKGIVFSGHDAGKMIAYDLKSGREIWSADEIGSFHAAPVIMKDLLVYGTSHGYFIARHYLTGELLYSINLGASVESKATFYDGRVFVHLRNHRVVALDYKTGKLLWGYKRSIPYTTTIQRSSRPVIAGGKVIVGFADGIVGALSIEDGVILWEKRLVSGKKFVDVDATPVVIGDNIAVNAYGSKLYLLNGRSGSLIKEVRLSFVSAPTYIKEKNIFVAPLTTGEIVILSSNLSEIKKIKLSDQPLKSVAIWKNSIVVSSFDGHLKMVSLKDYKVTWNKNLGQEDSFVNSSFAVSGDYLTFLTTRNYLWVYKRN